MSRPESMQAGQLPTLQAGSLAECMIFLDRQKAMNKRYLPMLQRNHERGWKPFSIRKIGTEDAAG